MASTESANPTLAASHGSVSRSTTTATPRARVPRRSPLEPSPTRATVPIAAARTTLGSARARSRNPPMPRRRRRAGPRPRTPASGRAPAGSPPAGSGWCPTPRSGGSARWCGSRPRAPGPSARRRPHQRRHQRALVVGSVPHRGTQRRPHRLGGPPPGIRLGEPGRDHHAPRGPRPGSGRTTPGEAPGQPQPRCRAAARARRVGDHQHRHVHVVRRAAAGDPLHVAAEQHPVAERGPATSRGSPVTVSSTVTDARVAGQPRDRVAGERSARTSPPASTASSTTSTPIAVLPRRGGEPRRARRPGPRRQRAPPTPSSTHGPAREQRSTDRRGAAERHQRAEQPARPGAEREQGHPQVGPGGARSRPAQRVTSGAS